MGRLGIFGWGALASLCLGFSKGFEKIGDVAFNAGDPSRALIWHLMALASLIAFAVCGWKFLKALWRKHRVFGLGDEQTDIEREAIRPATKITDAPQAPVAFDPDAALARYMASRPSDTAQPMSQQRTNGFGRKGV